MMPKSRRKGKFIFLKQILEESLSDKGIHSKNDVPDASPNSDGSLGSCYASKPNANAGPIGEYPVLFYTKTCKNKSCQTKVSSFPLFPLPGEAEWISDDDKERNKKARVSWKKSKKSRTKNFNCKLATRENNVDSPRISKVKNSDGSRKDFKTEHQLKESNNPLLQAWLHKKNILSRKQRKLERQQKRAKRAALEEESRLNSERLMQSNEKVGEWFKRKEKEARIARRRSKTKVSPQEEDGPKDPTSPNPPPTYRVVKSFYCAELPSSRTKLATAIDVAVRGSPEVNIERTSDTGTDTAKTEATTFPGTCTSADSIHCQDKVGCGKCDSNVSGNMSAVEKLKLKPKTAFVKPNASISQSASKGGINRPKTAVDNASKSQTNKASHVTASTLKLKQSMTYDEWLKAKRDDSKTKVIQKRRELIDSHLEAVIAELGKRRVEKIMSPRKGVDTGLKDASHSTKPTGENKTKRGKLYRWASRKSPRPEPQGCDCSENQKPDIIVTSAKEQGSNIFGEAKSDANVKKLSVESLEQDKNDSRKQDSANIQTCQEVNDRYWELKPSIEKVKKILDSEIKKLKEPSNTMEKNVVLHPKCHGANVTTAEPSDTTKTADLTGLRSKSLRPKTAQPTNSARLGSRHLTSNQAKNIASHFENAVRKGPAHQSPDLMPESIDANTKETDSGSVRPNSEEQAKKIASDLDVLGLCRSDSECESVDFKAGDEHMVKSTVRENYFDYGSEVDSVTTKPTAVQ